jgi:NTE family protein
MLRRAWRSDHEPAAGPLKPPVVGLALGGGGVRGAAELGVLSVLEEAGIAFDVVAGTSVGAIVGLGYVAGVPTSVMLEHFRKSRWMDLTRPSWGSRLSMLDANPMADALLGVVGVETFEDLPKPLAVVASDLRTATTVVFTSGPLREAVLASSAVPGILEPLRRDDMLIVDGGLTENLPVSQARALGADIVVAVDIIAGPNGAYEPKDVRDMMMMGWTIIEWTSEQRGRELADVVISPPVSRFNMMDFGLVPTLYDIGVESAREQLPDVIAAIARAGAA